MCLKQVEFQYYFVHILKKNSKLYLNTFIVFIWHISNPFFNVYYIAYISNYRYSV